MTDQLDTATIRARYCGLPTDGIVVDAAAVERDVEFLCDALDAAVIVDECLRSEVDYVIADMTALRAENERLRQALEGMTDRYVGLAASGDAGFWDPEVEPEVIAARAALAQKEG